MPSPPDFLNGFGVYKGMNIGGFTLKRISIKHIEITKYRKYGYPITLTFVGDGDYSSFKEELTSKLSGYRKINSRYGNPYQCTFGSLHFARDKDSIRVESLGHGVRIFE